ncbi:TRAP transporter small permease [Georgenia faecalis]|uniref:TRAP transporter small permease n=1 Tax=Georgenia faecalis TaxID=2483799 RepID=A0ABV9D6G6_9MICO|nr:TRAP transporter small permease [Georgenia faecalis]
MSAARLVRGVLSGAERVLMTISGVAITLVSVVLVLQVFMRYVLNSPTVWSEEFATLMFVWCVMAAIPVAVRHSEHIAVTIVVDRLRGTARRVVVALGYLLSAGLFGLVTVYAALMLPTGARQLMTGLTIATGTDISLLAMYLIVPIGMGFSFVYALEKLVATLRGEFDTPLDPVQANAPELEPAAVPTSHDKDA